MKKIARDIFYLIANDGIFYGRVGAGTGFVSDLNDAILYHNPKQAVATISDLNLTRDNIHKVEIVRIILGHKDDEYPWVVDKR